MQKKYIVWIIAGVLIIGGLALALTPKSTSPAVSGSWPESRDVSNAELKDFVAKGARLVDVRTAGEFTGGHIEGAENVPVGDVTGQSGSWDKKIPIVVYCQTGSRSLNAFQYLQAQGFEHVYNLPQGMSGWDGTVVQGAGGPAANTGPGKGPALGKPIMYDFASATWPSCIKMKPVVDGLRERYTGKIEIKRMDTDGNDQEVAKLADTFGIQYVPTFVFVNSDGTVSGTVVGEVPESKLVEELSKLK